MADKEKKKTKPWKRKFYFFMIAVILLMSGVFFMLRDGKQDCFIEHHTFLYDEVKQGDECKLEQCLFITTFPKDSVIERTFYFDTEDELLSEKLQLVPNEKIRIQWCKISPAIGYRIRGVDR